ncbi:MAG TPA: hypothetical protein VFE01_03475, partial [Terracidiphilus sp.]|nr:hypothetical protein [Terracidiphilus sp.]
GRLPAWRAAAFMSILDGSPGGQPAPRICIEFMPILTRMGARDGAIQYPEKTVRKMKIRRSAGKVFRSMRAPV